MAYNDKPLGPDGGVIEKYLTSQRVLTPLEIVVSGEITTSKLGVPVGSVRTAARITDVWLSLGACGRDNSNTHRLTANVKINGTTCLTTQPYIPANNGSASEQKTTKISGDTGIVQAVISDSANTLNPGDVVTADLALTRTATPATEMANAILVVEFEPFIL
jgi:hypothetical protein